MSSCKALGRGSWLVPQVGEASDMLFIMTQLGAWEEHRPASVACFGSVWKAADAQIRRDERALDCMDRHEMRCEM